MKVKVSPKEGKTPIHPDQGYRISGEMVVEHDKGISRLQKSGEIKLEQIQEAGVEVENKSARTPRKK